MGRLAEVVSEQSSEKCKTFVFMGEGYTLGNSLVAVISQNPDVEFCACFVNHPAEGNIYLRIQAKNGKAIDILRKGLQDFEKICDHTIETFNNAYEQFKTSRDMFVDST
ncbi:probable DNA-directed RNA polymerases I and III subunit RPAC2 [Bombus vosnesenskii]|uniref:Probable DNA-directed RNA polymerases I and III subunit RPAC2 n=3 Tax=Pyrobombus TaxID=144703 RepID=A0A6J3LIB5_9HYME|nr:probable DNA-directed RNA polymerases I and III subunit RPAC2 [Bombus impatiens]XP_033198469.1 probable DNA-directed RNA polymerases I and III subunit RPAC2 [Bombus vancouverensis nearcticus]XP_033316444.1 probable DNA-directed RNA polymerases I and III subunit RPAC2 [Bombus bifarius]XP_033365268.1 probable DNA-directed RNA polymerases I and III subunit RPAC2 [Bombus vosnesenskii]XP_050493210.1 probable DNA-directed RNA polymerases I and III subunit RPAC2 [Bombus huntii]